MASAYEEVSLRTPEMGAYKDNFGQHPRKRSYYYYYYYMSSTFRASRCEDIFKVVDGRCTGPYV
eukprot:6185591-Pleurochrysis_carterae.AAC.1